MEQSNSFGGEGTVDIKGNFSNVAVGVCWNVLILHAYSICMGEYMYVWLIDMCTGVKGNFAEMVQGFKGYSDGKQELLKDFAAFISKRVSWCRSLHVWLVTCTAVVAVQLGNYACLILFVWLCLFNRVKSNSRIHEICKSLWTSTQRNAVALRVGVGALQAVGVCADSQTKTIHHLIVNLWGMLCLVLWSITCRRKHLSGSSTLWFIYGLLRKAARVLKQKVCVHVCVCWFLHTSCN